MYNTIQYFEKAEMSNCFYIVDTGFGYLIFKSTTEILYISDSEESAVW